MTPDQRLGVWAAKSAATADEIIHWIGDHSPALQVCANGLTEDASALASKAAKLAAAALEPPCIGVLGSTTASGRSILHALTSPNDVAMMAGFEGLPQSFDIERTILPADRSAIVRYSTARDTGRSIPGYPVRVALLAATGVIKILTSIYQASPAAHAPDLGFADGLHVALASARETVNASASSSLTAEDIRDVRAHLTAAHPHAPNLDRLSAAGYWEQLASLGPYLQGPALHRLLAMLWGRDEGLTAVFTLYDAALSSLGYARDILCPIEALAERDPVSGWFRPHPLSILSSATIGHPINDDAARVHVARRHGQVTEISRAVIAALTAHVVIHVRGGDAAAAYDAAGHGLTSMGVRPVGRNTAATVASNRQTASPDVLDFPTPSIDAAIPTGTAHARARSDVTGSWHKQTAPQNHRDIDRDNDRRDAELTAHLQRFAAAKPVYLFRRAVEYHTITGLIVCVAPDEPADDAMAATLGVWVAQVQGATPATRARQKPALLLVGPDDQPDMQAALAHLSEMVQAHDSWLQEWSPGRTFQNVVLIPPASRTPVYRARELVRSSTAFAYAPAPTVDAQSPAHIAGLLGAFIATVTPATKTRQLSQQLTTVRRQLRARLLRLDPSQEPDQVNAWRTETGNTMQAGLLRIVDQGRFDRLLAALAPSDEAMEHLIETRHALYLARSDAAQDNAPGLPVGTNRRPGWTPNAPMTSAYAAEMADAVLAYWLTAMRRTASAGRLAHDTGLPQALLDHLIDEIGLGVLRTGLGAHLTYTLQPAAREIANFHGANANGGNTIEVRRIAAVASRTIGRFLEDLCIADSPLFDTAPQFEKAALRSSGAGTAKHHPQSVTDGVMAVTGTEFASHWCTALDRLIDENIAASPMLRTLIGSDRQLGELLAELSSSPTEVET